MRLHREDVASPVGTIVVLTDADGRLRALDFEDYADHMRLLLDRHYGRGIWQIAPAPSLSTARRALDAYFAGDVTAIDGIETATAGTPFQREVWAALRAVPAAVPTTYGVPAARIGRPKAVRAVGRANGANPIAIVVPCHRVAGLDGTLTGYGGGLHRKRWLLDHEARCLAGAG